MLLESGTCQDNKKYISVGEEKLEKEWLFGNSGTYILFVKQKIHLNLEPPSYIFLASTLL